MRILLSLLTTTLLLTGAEYSRSEEPAAKKDAAEFHAGFRKFKLTYRPAEAEADVERQVYLWYPTADEAPQHRYQGQVGYAKVDAEVADGKHPLILFSHGFMGASDQSIFITEELARQGYIVAALDHADALRAKRDKPLAIPNFGDAKSWDDSKFRDRREDVVALLERMLVVQSQKDSFLLNHIDVERIGAAGHSLGGYTVMGMIGGWPAWEDKRIKSALLLSPYATPFLESGKLADVKVPVMLQGGTWDLGITPFLPLVYDRLKCPRYYLVLKKETHFGWTNLVSLDETTKECIAEGNPELICRYAVAFFDKTLCKRDFPELTAEEPRLNKLQFEAAGGKSSGNARPVLERRK